MHLLECAPELPIVLQGSSKTRFQTKIMSQCCSVLAPTTRAEFSMKPEVEERKRLAENLEFHCLLRMPLCTRDAATQTGAYSARLHPEEHQGAAGAPKNSQSKEKKRCSANAQDKSHDRFPHGSSGIIERQFVKEASMKKQRWIQYGCGSLSFGCFSPNHNNSNSICLAIFRLQRRLNGALCPMESRRRQLLSWIFMELLGRLCLMQGNSGSQGHAQHLKD
ncbi:uncharacterized protein LOC135576353 [Columba livia]|uniref:uncharacterized protein LOC135576353 n=1 Tax=Columba livia TaxID=8932 RepID=UPI0031BABA95